VGQIFGLDVTTKGIVSAGNRTPYCPANSQSLLLVELSHGKPEEACNNRGGMRAEFCLWQTCGFRPTWLLFKADSQLQEQIDAGLHLNNHLTIWTGSTDWLQNTHKRKNRCSGTWKVIVSRGL
jgi:hypothetical protein